jgi:hypothetical protein
MGSIVATLRVDTSRVAVRSTVWLGAAVISDWRIWSRNLP